MTSGRREHLVRPGQAAIDRPTRILRRPRGQRAVVGTREVRRHALARLRRIRLGLAASDAIAAVTAAMVLRSAHIGAGVTPDLWLMVLVGPLVWVGVFQAFGLYRTVSSWEEIRRLLGATALGVLLMVLVTPWATEQLSRSSLVWTWALAFLLELFVRGLFRWQMAGLARDGGLAMRTAVIGINREAREIARTLSVENEGFAVVGHITNGDDDGFNDHGLLTLGSLGQLDEIVRENQIECVFLASTTLPGEDLLRITKSCRQAHVELRVWANIPDILTPRFSIQPMAESAMLALTPVRLTGAHGALKRTFDVIVASLGVLLTLPLLAAVALGIRLTSPGPVLFRQTRVTKNGRGFTMYKFRTMVNDPEQALEGKVVDLTEPFFKLQDDPRLTRFGRLLRRWSLDELPQLFNVLLGDMSIVGPRPLPVEQVGANLELLDARHEVRCGITGWWQVSGRSEIDSAEALRLDLFYIENWSIGLDVYVLLRTVGAVLAKRGAW
jgi:exopolysaccharide biosynthesis polyprenyl glycosylphosphotransferase